MPMTRRSRRTGAALALATVVAALAALPAGAGGDHSAPVYDHAAALTGAAEAPDPGDPDGAGTVNLALEPQEGRACLRLALADIAAPTAAHIHEGSAGVPGDVVVDFSAALAGQECVDGVDKDVLRAIRANPAAYYVNVHNARFPAGAIRGQVFLKGALADEVALPAGFQPEGVAVSEEGTFYAGSLAGGAVYRGDLRTGKGAVLVPPAEGRVAVGLQLDGGRLWVAGGPTGQAHVYDAGTGKELGSWPLATESFINDVAVLGGTAWFTDSLNEVLYGVRLGQDEVTTLPLTGDLVFQEGFNTNGIEATPDGTALVIVQTNTGLLFSVDPTTGVTAGIDLGEDDVANGDGLLFRGGFLYVVQNQLNQIARVELAEDLSSGTVVARLTDADLDVPTTVGGFSGRLWAVNARFGTPPEADTFYSVVSVRG